MISVDIKTISHQDQDYPTVGNWNWQGSHLTIRVSRMSKWRYEFLVAVHEFIEAILCFHAGISEEEVTKFDLKFEQARADGLHSPDEEPGFAFGSPYKFQHRMATWIERFLAILLKVDWKKYNQEINSL